jgi:hypothetical protein
MRIWAQRVGETRPSPGQLVGGFSPHGIGHARGNLCKSFLYLDLQYLCTQFFEVLPIDVRTRSQHVPKPRNSKVPGRSAPTVFPFAQRLPWFYAELPSRP